VLDEDLLHVQARSTTTQLLTASRSSKLTAVSGFIPKLSKNVQMLLKGKTL
jgi:hypothetical protein